MLRGLLVVLAVLMPAGCGGSAVAASSAPAGTFTSPHFTIHYTSLDGATISESSIAEFV